MGLGIAGLAAVVGSVAFVRSKAASHTYPESDVPHAPVALVLGAQVKPDGTPSAFLAARLDLAKRLYDAGRVEMIIVSGDHRAPEYDEPVAMRDYLIRAGVPGTKLILDPGQYTFKNHCAACHTIGQGDHLGPDLLGVATTRDREWLTRFIVNPEKVRAAGDPVALALREKYKQVVMPALDLGRSDAAVLIDFIDKESRAIRASAPASGAKASAAPAANVSVNVAPILEPYLRIQRALNVDTVAGVKGDARLIADQTATLGSKGTAMQAAAGEVQQASDLTTARAAFARLSDAVIQYARESGAGFGDEVKVAYCPMVQKYWLQKGDTIQNPFYGKQMSDCGRIAATAPTSTK